MKLARRVSKIQPSPTLAITSKAKAMKAEGIDVVGFGAGEPDFDTPEHIKAVAKKALDAGYTKYTPVPGTPELKDAVIAKFRRDNGLEYKRENIIVSVGAKHSIYNVAQAFFEEGDEVVIPAPYWVSYPDIVLLAGATPVIVDTKEETGFKLTPQRLDQAITPRTKCVVLNSPSNPTGAAYTEEELKRIADVVVRRGVTVLSDDIYEKLVYDGFRFVSIASFGEEIRKRTIVVNGLSKAYSMTGWRIGYVAADKDLVAAMNKIQSQSTSNPVSFCDKAAIEALNGPQDFMKEWGAEFDRRRRLIVERLNKIPGVSCLLPQGAFYVFPNFSKVYGKKTPAGRVIDGSAALAAYLLEDHRVAAVPGVAFGADECQRLSYATSMKNIEKGIDRIEQAIKALH
ncbi:MAG: pyridoxal phosphate-dependent aminotransferase [Thermodesulfobacteriota bacterium]|nr:pyridoxal phosphate-dependent aminotransferase [Thermodesulfobacteriota bacterium]